MKRLNYFDHKNYTLEIIEQYQVKSGNVVQLIHNGEEDYFLECYLGNFAKIQKSDIQAYLGEEFFTQSAIHYHSQPKVIIYRNCQTVWKVQIDEEKTAYHTYAIDSENFQFKLIKNQIYWDGTQHFIAQ